MCLMIWSSVQRLMSGFQLMFAASVVRRRIAFYLRPRYSEPHIRTDMTEAQVIRHSRKQRGSEQTEQIYPVLTQPEQISTRKYGQ